MTIFDFIKIKTIPFYSVNYSYYHLYLTQQTVRDTDKNTNIILLKLK